MADRLLQKGEVIGQRFELTEPLGKGAFGAVWKALDRTTDSDTVAVKVIFDKYRQDKKMLGRFVQEAKILEKLDHPNICRPLAWEAEGPDVFLAMEYIDGETLDEKFSGNSKDDSPVPLEGIAWICDQLCAAIDYAHEQGIVHRDLKPRNVMVNRRGQRLFVKVLDFGIAKMLVGSELDPTTVGRVLGSVLYVSPEQVLGHELTPRADIFSLGTILFELVTLKRAWARDEDARPLAFHKVVPQGSLNSHVSVLRRIAREARPVPTKERPELPAAIDGVLRRAMAIEPEKRFETATQFAVAVRAALVDGVEDADPGEVTIKMRKPAPELPADAAASEAAGAPSSAQNDSGSSESSGERADEPLSSDPPASDRNALEPPAVEAPPAKGRTRGTLLAGIAMLAAALGVILFLLMK